MPAESPDSFAERYTAAQQVDHIGEGWESGTACPLIETAKPNVVDSQTWLTDVPGRIADHKITRLDESVPWQ